MKHIWLEMLVQNVETWHVYTGTRIWIDFYIH